MTYYLLRNPDTGHYLITSSTEESIGWRLTIEGCVHCYTSKPAFKVKQLPSGSLEIVDITTDITTKIEAICSFPSYPTIGLIRTDYPELLI